MKIQDWFITGPLNLQFGDDPVKYRTCGSLKF